MSIRSLFGKCEIFAHNKSYLHLSWGGRRGQQPLFQLLARSIRYSAKENISCVTKTSPRLPPRWPARPPPGVPQGSCPLQLAWRGSSLATCGGIPTPGTVTNCHCLRPARPVCPSWAAHSCLASAPQKDKDPWPLGRLGMHGLPQTPACSQGQARPVSGLTWGSGHGSRASGVRSRRQSPCSR